MTIKAVTKYETPDGKSFTTELEAEGHIEFLSIEAAVEAYVAAQGIGPAEATRARKYISGFRAFLKTYDGPLAKPVAPAVDAANDEQAQAVA